MPEKGDVVKPELVIFIDEAHLIFNQASQALLDQIENIVNYQVKRSGDLFCNSKPN